MSYGSGMKTVALGDSTRRTYGLPDETIKNLWDPKKTPYLVWARSRTKNNTPDRKPTKLVTSAGLADFQLFAGGAGSWSSVANGATISNQVVQLTKDGSDDPGYLVPFQTLRVKTTGGDTVAIISAVTSQQDINLVSVSSSPNNIADNDQIIVTGSAFAEGAAISTAFYDTTTSEYSYTEIFKMAIDVTNSLKASGTFGGDEYDRLMERKRYQFFTLLENGLLFNDRGSTTVGSATIQTTYGMLPYVENNSSTSNVFERVYNDYSYFDLIDDMRQWFTKSADNGTTEKLCLCGAGPIGFFSKVGEGMFWNNPNVNVKYGESELGFDVTTVKHPWGALHLVHEPLFRSDGGSNAFYEDYMLGIDEDNVEYRPLNNGKEDRDTHLEMNLPTTADKVLHEWRAEVANQPFHAPTHALFKFS